jgi:hypothetical protein
MTYVPTNPEVYSASFSAIAGIVCGGRYPQNPDAVHYYPNAAVVEIIAEEMDARWTYHAMPPVTQTDLTVLANATEEFFSGRYPQSLVLADYQKDCDAIIAIVSAAHVAAANVPITGTGPQGPQGNQGYQGAFGGPQGNQGTQGYQSAVPGVQGNQGNQGYQGQLGAGYQGGSGTQGNQGNQGSTGPQGDPQGAQGNQGYQGDRGAPGTGAQGDQGYQGYQGVQGGGGTSFLDQQYVAKGVLLNNVANLAAFALSGGAEYDGVTYINGDIVLLAAQTTPKENGPYVVTVVCGAGVLTRPSWWVLGSTKPYGVQITIGPDGQTYGNTYWKTFTSTPITVDTDNPDLWPVSYSTRITLVSGIGLMNGPVRSVNTKGFAIRLGAGSGVATTIQYVLSIGGPTPGAGLLGAMPFEAMTDAGITALNDMSQLDVLIINK